MGFDEEDALHNSWMDRKHDISEDFPMLDTSARSVPQEGLATQNFTDHKESSISPSGSPDFSVHCREADPSSANNSIISPTALPFRSMSSEVFQDYPDELYENGSMGLVELAITSSRLVDRDKSDIHVEYLVEYHSLLADFKGPAGSVFRRFKDFSWLKTSLSSNFPACIVPPFPDKQLLSYFDRFQEDFISKRRGSLERFIKKLAIHPIFQTSEQLKYFLECEGSPSRGIYSVDSSSNVSLSTSSQINVLEKISDKLLSTFKRLRHPNEKFDLIRSDLVRSSELLRNVYTKQKTITKCYQDSASYSQSLSEMYSLLGVSIGPELQRHCQMLSQSMTNIRFYDDEFSSLQFVHFQLSLKEILQYIMNAISLLERREKKQQDYEEISEYVKNLSSKRESTKESLGCESSTTSSTWKKRLSFVTGGPSETMQSKLFSIESKLQEAMNKMNQCRTELEFFNSHIEKELKFFSNQKNMDFRRSFTDYVDFQISYNTKCLNTWKNMISNLDALAS